MSIVFYDVHSIRTHYFYLIPWGYIKLLSWEAFRLCYQAVVHQEQLGHPRRQRYSGRHTACGINPRHILVVRRIELRMPEAVVEKGQRGAVGTLARKKGHFGLH